MRMFLSASEELSLFFCAQRISLIICLLCDLLRGMIPEKLPHRVRDLAYAAVCSVIFGIFLLLWQRELDGNFRWYTLLSFFLTAFLYYSTIHKPIFSAYCIIVKKILKIFHTIFKILLTVRDFLGKITIYVIMFSKRLFKFGHKGRCYEKS